MCAARGGRAAVVAVTLLAACATNTAPRGFLPAPVESQLTAYGGWIELAYGSGRRPSRVEGELLAVQGGGDSLYILTARGAIAVATSTVRKAKLTGYDSQSGQLGTWTFLGVLSTASHGFVLVISAPVWILSGSLASASQSHQPESVYPKVGWDAIRRYARFPQGLPAGIDLTVLRAKPLP